MKAGEFVSSDVIDSLDGILQAEAALLRAALDEARLEAWGYRCTYLELREARAGIDELIPARMLWGLAEQHVGNVRNALEGARDRISCARRSLDLPAGTQAAASGQVGL